MKNCEISHPVAVLQRLRTKGKISQLQALRDFGCMRLAAVIHRLRKKGHPIVTTWREQGKTKYAVYRMGDLDDE